MEELKKIALEELKDQHFDCLAVGMLDFNKGSFKSFEIIGKTFVSKKPILYFDLASLTKPLTLASVFHFDESLFDKDLQLLLCHCAGLPAWGRLSHDGWKEVILSKEVKESPVLYSDFSALRTMLELEKKTGKKLKELASFYWDKDLMNWLDLKDRAHSPRTGMRGGSEIRGVVHDDNAFVIGEFCSHAGMFATIDGLCKSLLNLQEKTQFVDKQQKYFDKFDFSKRYLNGWDTVSNPAESLAGSSCGAKTFGHLGFTGTSIWIDSERGIGTVILTNATRDYWYQRDELARLRKRLGTISMSS